jgi:hypothetical protein
MSVVVVFGSSVVISLFKLSSFLLRTRSLSQTVSNFHEIIMSGSIDSLSSCEIAGSDYGMLRPAKSEILSTKSEVICQFSFRELQAGSSFVICRCFCPSLNVFLMCSALFHLAGVVLRTCERFSINFLAVSNKQDVALHFNPRLPQNYIVRNSKIGGKSKLGHENAVWLIAP